jgi:hypothetical protein
MPTYTATFFTTADYASRPIEAANAQQAMELARKAYDEHFTELEFRSHDNIEPLEEIEICNNEDFGDGAFWGKRRPAPAPGRARFAQCARRPDGSGASCTITPTNALNPLHRMLKYWPRNGSLFCWRGCNVVIAEASVSPPVGRRRSSGHGRMLFISTP